MASEIKNDVNRQSVEYYENEGPVRRCPTHPNLLDNLEGLKTVFDLAKYILTFKYLNDDFTNSFI